MIREDRGRGPSANGGTEADDDVVPMRLVEVAEPGMRQPAGREE